MSRKSKGASKTTVRYRNAGSGQFMTEAQAKRRPQEKVVRERVPKPGYGDTKQCNPILIVE
jgi:hypothetical protein